MLPVKVHLRVIKAFAVCNVTLVGFAIEFDEFNREDDAGDAKEEAPTKTEPKTILKKELDFTLERKFQETDCICKLSSFDKYCVL